MSGDRLFVNGLFAGKAVRFRGEEHSAIAKQAVSEPVRIGTLGLAGDEQADHVHHGGADKAVHLYPHEHYAHWRERLGDHALLAAPGAFGENISARGGDETNLCLGDRFRFGSAVLEISHGRQPCWKIDHRFGVKGVTAHIVRTGRCGLYFRVLEEGEARSSGTLERIAQPLPRWPVARVFRLLIGGGAFDDREGVRELAHLEVLAQTWRDRARQLAEG